jgi:hypothetical protein
VKYDFHDTSSGFGVKLDGFVKSTRNLRRAFFSFHKYQKTLDSRFRGNDGKKNIRTFYEGIKLETGTCNAAPAAGLSSALRLSLSSSTAQQLSSSPGAQRPRPLSSVVCHLFSSASQPPGTCRGEAEGEDGSQRRAAPYQLAHSAPVLRYPSFLTSDI